MKFWMMDFELRFLIQDKSFNFSILSIELYKELSKNKEFIFNKAISEKCNKHWSKRK